MENNLKIINSSKKYHSYNSSKEKKINNETNENKKNCESSEKNKNTLFDKIEKKNDFENELFQKEYKIKEFKIIKEIGRGGYATVHLVERESDKKFFALKLIDKKFLLKYNKKDEALIEKYVLSHINHPSIIKLYSCFQTLYKLCYVLEYCPNHDLEYIINKCGILPNNIIVNIFAEIVNVVNYLHNTLNLAHNDLKLSNFLLDKNYHIKLIDFETCRYENKIFDSKTKTFIENNGKLQREIIGTAEYLSPELLDDKIKSYKTNDIWALGVILYYFYHGHLPFQGNNEYLTFDLIRKGKYVLDENLNKEAKNLIKSLLKLNPNERLTIEQIKKTDYFKNINWENLLIKSSCLNENIINDLINQFQNNKINSNESILFWNNFLDEINNQKSLTFQNDFQIDIKINIEQIEINENYFYKDFYHDFNNCEFPILNLNKYNKNNKKLLYDGIVYNQYKECEMKLYNNKNLEIYKKHKLYKSFILNKYLNFHLNKFNNSLIINNFEINSTKIEIIKWYNYITQLMNT